MLKVSLLFISMGAVGATLFATRPAVRPVDDNDRRANDMRVSAGSADRLEVNVPLGSVTLIADNSREMTIHVVRSAKKPLDAEARRWLNDSFVKAESRDGVLIVRDHPFGKDSLKDINEHDSNGKGRDLDLDIQIHVPSNLAAKLEVGAGLADVRGQFRTLKANVGAGSLTSDSVKCSGKMDLQVGAGEVNMTIPSGASQEVSAAVGVGEITGLPGSAKRKEGIHLGDKRKGHTGQGESKVDVHVGAGSIKVESKDGIIASAMSEEPEKAESDEMESGDMDFQMDDKTGETIRKSIDLAMKAVHESLGSMKSDMKIDMGDMKFENMGDLKDLQDLKELKGLDQDLAKELAKIGPEIEKEMKNFKPEFEMSMKGSDRDFERSMKQVKPQIDKEIKKAMAEVQRAMKSIKPEIEKAMRQMKPEIEKAIHEAMKELDRAEKELKDHHKADLN